LHSPYITRRKQGKITAIDLYRVGMFLAVLHQSKEDAMITILLIVLILMLVGALPTYPYSRDWGYYPSGGVGLVLLILILLMVTGRL